MNWKTLVRDGIYLSPFLFLLVQTIPVLIINPLGFCNYNFLGVEKIFPLPTTIHTLTISLICFQFLLAFVCYRRLPFKYRMVLPILFVFLTIHVYEWLGSMMEWSIIGLPTTPVVLTMPVVIFLYCVLVYGFHKKFGIVKLDKWFWLFLGGFVGSMLLLPVSGFFIQLHAARAGLAEYPHTPLWALSKVLCYVTFVVWFRRKK